MIHYRSFALGCEPEDGPVEPSARASAQASELATALRLHELVALDVEDVSVSARKGLVVIRSGKGDVYREVPLNRPCRDALEPLIAERRKAATGGEALFVGPHGKRLTGRSIDRVVRKIGALAGLELWARAPSHLRDESGPRGQRSCAGRRAGGAPAA